MIGMIFVFCRMMIWLKEVRGFANVFLFFFLIVISNWSLMSKLLVYAVICIKSFGLCSYG